MDRVFVYWDNSNVFHEAQRLAEEHEGTPDARYLFASTSRTCCVWPKPAALWRRRWPPAPSPRRCGSYGTGWRAAGCR